MQESTWQCTKKDEKKETGLICTIVEELNYRYTILPSFRNNVEVLESEMMTASSCFNQCQRI